MMTLFHFLFIQRGWNLKSDNFFYFIHEETNKDEVIPATELTEQAVGYARELEMII